jgi:hypothetical protein
MSNLLNNPFFTGPEGTGPVHVWEDEHGSYDNMVIPDEWWFFCDYDEPFNGIHPGLVARRPECALMWHESLEDWITGTTSWVWKVFLNEPMAYAFEPAWPVVVEPGKRYHVYLKGAFECVDSYEGGKSFVDDPWAAWAWVSTAVGDSDVVNGFTHAALYRTLDFGEIAIPADVVEITPRFEFRWKYQSAGNNAFYDEVWLEPVGGGAPVVVDLAPIIARLDRANALLESINDAMWQ